MSGSAAKTDALLGLVCLFVLGAAGMCFMGMFWIGRVPPTLLAMGVCGLTAGASGLALALGYSKGRKLVFWAGALGAVAVAGDAINFYVKLNIPGNYYGWLIFGPYAAALAFVAARAKEVKIRGGLLRNWHGSSL